MVVVQNTAKDTKILPSVFVVSYFGSKIIHVANYLQQ